MSQKYSIELSSLDTVMELDSRGQTESIKIVKDSRGNHFLLKIYNSSTLRGTKIEVLESLVQWRRELPAQDRYFLDEHAAWPLRLVYDRGNFVGILIQVAPEKYWRIKNGESVPRNGSAVTSTLKNGEFFNCATRLHIMGLLLSIIIWFHKHHVVLGDIHLGNYLVGSDGSVMLIDMDSVRLNGACAFEFTENRSYAAPFDEHAHTERTDFYKYACVAIKTISRNTSSLSLSCCSGLINERQADFLKDWLEGKSVSGGADESLANQWIGCVDKKRGHEFVFTSNNILKTPSIEEKSRFHPATLPFDTHISDQEYAPHQATDSHETRVSFPAPARARVSSPALARTQVSFPAPARARVSSPALARTQVPSPGPARAWVPSPELACAHGSSSTSTKSRKTSSSWTRIAIAVFILIFTLIAFISLGDRIPGKLGDFAADLRSKIERIVSDGKTVTPTPTPLPTTARGCMVHTTDLQVGDCFNETDDGDTGGTDSDGPRQVGDVEVVDCSAPHGHEVYSNHQIAQPTFPDRDTMRSEAETACVTAFETYVGVPLDQSRYSVSYLAPSEGSWSQGDHTITCIIVNKDYSPITGSLRGAAQ